MIHYNLFGKTKALSFSLRPVISKILKEIAESEDLNDHIVSFIIVDNNEIWEINKIYRQIDRPTDVISFAERDGNPNHELGYELGEIYISYEKVIEQAKEYNHSELREFAFLVTHGMLHLLGYDHMNKEDEIKMFKRQDEILENIGINR